MVERLLAFKARLDEVLEVAFGRSEALGHAQKDAFEGFINARQNKPAELVAKFIDAQLKVRRGGGGVCGWGLGRA